MNESDAIRVAIRMLGEYLKFTGERAAEKAKA
jgi:hypothetical protein